MPSYNLTIHGVTVEREALKNEFGAQLPSLVDIVCSARSYGLKARTTKTMIARLEQTPLPALAWDQHDGIFPVLKTADDRPRVHITPPMTAAPTAGHVLPTKAGIIS